MGRKFWQLRNATEPGTGELLIYGPIGSDNGMGWFDDEVTPKQFREELDALGAISELRVFINSPGGDVFAGQAIHSMLKRHPANVTVYVDGLAASAAVLPVMAGDKVIMPRNAMLMIHNPYTIGIGDSEKFRKLADNLDQIRESIIAAYSDKTGMDPDEILPLLEAETWMTAEEAVELGFADEIEEAKQVSASMSGPGKLVVNGVTVDLERFRNPPQVCLGVDTSKVSRPGPDSYSTQGSTVLEAVSEYERRTLGRLAAREKSGRGLSDTDMGRWRQIQDVANQVLGRIAGGAATGADKDGAQKVAIEYERLRAILNGMPA